jgi:hypothetical protein
MGKPKPHIENSYDRNETNSGAGQPVVVLVMQRNAAGQIRGYPGQDYAELAGMVRATWIRGSTMQRPCAITTKAKRHAQRAKRARMAQMDVRARRC